SYTVANLPAKMQEKRFVTADGKPMLGLDGQPLEQAKVGSDFKPIIGTDGKPVMEPLSLVKLEPPGWMPEAVAQHLYPAGSRKLNPDAHKVLGSARKLVVDEEAGKLAGTTEERQKLERARELLGAFDVEAIDKA